jgi:hypothetical protein
MGGCGCVCVSVCEWASSAHRFQRDLAPRAFPAQPPPPLKLHVPQEVFPDGLTAILCVFGGFVLSVLCVNNFNGIEGESAQTLNTYGTLASAPPRFAWVFPECPLCGPKRHAQTSAQRLGDALCRTGQRQGRTCPIRRDRNTGSRNHPDTHTHTHTHAHTLSHAHTHTHTHSHAHTHTHTLTRTLFPTQSHEDTSAGSKLSQIAKFPRQLHEDTSGGTKIWRGPQTSNHRVPKAGLRADLGKHQNQARPVDLQSQDSQGNLARILGRSYKTHPAR